jgi:hypothetical protein
MASALVPGIYTRLVIIGVAVSVDRRDTGSFAFAKDEIWAGLFSGEYQHRPVCFFEVFYGFNPLCIFFCGIRRRKHQSFETSGADSNREGNGSLGTGLKVPSHLWSRMLFRNSMRNRGLRVDYCQTQESFKMIEVSISV